MQCKTMNNWLKWYVAYRYEDESILFANAACITNRLRFRIATLFEQLDRFVCKKMLNYTIGRFLVCNHAQKLHKAYRRTRLDVNVRLTLTGSTLIGISFLYSLLSKFLYVLANPTDWLIYGHWCDYWLLNLFKNSH